MTNGNFKFINKFIFFKFLFYLFLNLKFSRLSVRGLFKVLEWSKFAVARIQCIFLFGCFLRVLCHHSNKATIWFRV